MRKFIVAGCLVVLGGCATPAWQEGVRPWWTLNERDFAAIAPEKSKAEVERAVGRPLLVETFPRLREEVWSYRFKEGVTRVFGAEVHFRADGGVTYVTTYEDTCVRGPTPCH